MPFALEPGRAVVAAVAHAGVDSDSPGIANATGGSPASRLHHF